MTSLKNAKLAVIIATFNSAHYLPLVLESIREQTFSQKNITIWIVDGGSTDKTREIARSFGCKIISNPKVEPVSAKLLGYKKAKGDFIMFTDADEVLVNKNSIKNKISLLLRNPQVKAAIPNGYTNPDGSSIIRHYINEFGDPFSFFIYRISKNAGFFINELKKQFCITIENDQSIIFTFISGHTIPIIELGAAGSIIDLRYLKKQYSNFNSYVFAHLFYLLSEQRCQVAIMKNDPLMHYSSQGMSGYLKKIQWRIHNNIFFKSKMGEAGFSGRSNYLSNTDRFKKYFFIPYALSVFLPIYDSFWLILTRKDIRYLIHFILVEYTMWFILQDYILLLLGYKPVLKSYDQKKII